MPKQAGRSGREYGLERMRNRFISSVGGYLPLLRFERDAGARALRSVGLGGKAAGRRALGGWDEDPVTFGVEAARAALRAAGRTSDDAPPSARGDGPDRLVFASTSAPFLDRCHATLVASALGLPETIRTGDVAGSRRCAVGALLDALLGQESVLVTAGEKRLTRPGSPQHLGFGDGGAAVLVGGQGEGEQGAARLLGHASLSHDLIDSYTSRATSTPYAAEERFVREIAAQKMLAPTIKAACAAAGISPSAIAHAAVHEPLAGMWPQIAKPLGITAPNHAATLEAQAGDLGAAHALFALGLAFAAAKPGDIVLLCGFGSGCDALLFEMGSVVRGAREAGEALAQGRTTGDYVRLLSLTEAIALDYGVRSEFEQKAQATVLERHGRDTMGFMGGRDAAGNVQFPKTRMPVRPGATGPEPMEDVRLADLPATLISVTADRLNYTPDPPFWFGLVQFDNGARVLMELTDADQPVFAVGDRLRMRLRIKSLDRRRGFRTYFWKAAPARRPALEG